MSSLEGAVRLKRGVGYGSARLVNGGQGFCVDSWPVLPHLTPLTLPGDAVLS